MEEILNHIKKSFNNKIGIRKRKPGVFQLLLPIFHEDGDMVDIFIEKGRKGEYILCDYGMTIMRLSYSYEIDTENKEAIFQRILAENYLIEDQGNLYYTTDYENLFSDIMHVINAFMKIGSMRYFKREVIESLFYEYLDEFVASELTFYHPKSKVIPIPNREDLEVDWELRPNGFPLYLFGVKDSSKARLATISCLEFLRENLNFRSLIVHEDFEKLSKKDRSLLTNACDKQFTTLDEFKLKAINYLEREKNK